MKKVLFIMSSTLPFPPFRGGAVQTLVNYLIVENEQQNKFSFDVATIDFKYKYPNYKNTELKLIKIPRFLMKIREKNLCFINKIANKIIDLLYLKGLKKILTNNKYDTIIFENTIVFINKLEKYTGDAKKILHAHNEYTADFNNESKIFDKFDKIICVSNYILDRIKLTGTKTKLKTVYNGIDLNRFKKNVIERKKIREKYNFSDDTMVFIYSGRLVKTKGILELIKAINSVENNVALLIVGSKVSGNNNYKDSFYSELENELIKGKNKIFFTGYVNYNEIDKYYSAADIGVLPALNEEALSLSVIEYMSVGMPIIITNSGGMPELMIKKNGIIIEKNSVVDNLIFAINEMIKANNLEELSKNSLYNSKFFSIEKYIKEMFEEII